MDNDTKIANDLSVSELSEYYSTDEWDLRLHPDFVNLSEKQKETLLKSYCYIIKFPSEDNPYICSELRMYCTYLLQTKHHNLVTFSSNKYTILNVLDFVKNKYPSIKTIIDIPVDDLLSNFLIYLSEKGIKTIRSFSWNINRAMEKPVYKGFAPVYSFMKGFYQFMFNLKEEVYIVSEFEKDQWDIRYLPFTVEGYNPSRPRYIISFKNIKQHGLKQLAKKFIWQRLNGGIKYSASISDLKGINLISQFLHEKYPFFDDLNTVTREIIEEFIGYVECRNLAERTKSSRIGSVRIFFDVCQLNQWEGAPKGTLLLLKDSHKKHHKLPRPIPGTVITQLNENLEHLPIQLARMVVVIQAIGMRISELCSLIIDALKKDNEGDYYLEYSQDPISGKLFCGEICDFQI